MPRYYNAGAEAITPELFAFNAVDDKHREELLTLARKTHPVTAPSRDKFVMADGKASIKVPPMFCQRDMHGNAIERTLPWVPGSVSFGIPGLQFYVVPPGAFVDVDYSVPEKVVRDAAPHLLTEAEYQALQSMKASKTADVVAEGALVVDEEPKRKIK